MHLAVVEAPDYVSRLQCELYDARGFVSIYYPSPRCYIINVAVASLSSLTIINAFLSQRYPNY